MMRAAIDSVKGENEGMANRQFEVMLKLIVSEY